MGRIKSKLVKKTAFELIEKKSEIFSKNFEENKKILGNSMPSKKIRNQIAGYIVRLKKAENKLIQNGATN
ncbi:MAG: 30S ribosomal protein S17e [Candidatus Pacearchaeota archaeon]